MFLRQIEISNRALEGLGCHADGLGERRVRVDGEANILGVGAHLDRQRGLGNEVACVGPDNSAADDPVGIFVEQHLGDALVAAEAERASAL
jgi:hypothetical protein